MATTTASTAQRTTDLAGVGVRGNGGAPVFSSMEGQPRTVATLSGPHNQAEPKPRVLTYVGRYLPGFKAGGPVRSLSNLVHRLAGEFIFLVVTSDRDIGDRVPYSCAQNSGWVPTGRASAKYLKPGLLGALGWHRTLLVEPHDLVYLNSFFTPMSIEYVALRRLRLLPRRPLVLAPRGSSTRCPEAEAIPKASLHWDRKTLGTV